MKKFVVSSVWKKPVAIAGKKGGRKIIHLENILSVHKTEEKENAVETHLENCRKAGSKVHSYDLAILPICLELLDE